MQGYRITGRFNVACPSCGRNTSRAYAREHGRCKSCVTGIERKHTPVASRDEQKARYIDCGPAAWDDR